MDKTEKWWEPITRFIVHVLVGTIIFIVIAIVSVVVDLVVDKLAFLGANSFTVRMLSSLADLILIVDSILFLLHLVQSVLKAFRETFKK